ncbi:hypothetical protein ACFSQ7_48440 [Paenibacillus rhizoplanae]
MLSCLFNMGWLLLWHYLYIELSLVAMVLLLLSLIVIYRKTRFIADPTTGEKWLVKAAVQPLPRLDLGSHHCQCQRCAGEE